MKKNLFTLIPVVIIAVISLVFRKEIKTGFLEGWNNAMKQVKPD